MSGKFSKNVYFYLGAITILLLFLNWLGFLSPVKSFFQFLVSPLTLKINEATANFDDNYRFFKNREEFFFAYNKCEIDLQDKHVLEAQNKLLAEENKELKNQIGFLQEKQTEYVTANVLGKNTSSIEQSIIIDKGESSGIKIGHPVITGKGILVGKVEKIESDTSVVRLVNDNRSKVAATILNKEKSLGVVEGGYGISMRMSFIPRNEIISIGDDIVTSGLEVEMPNGLLIGHVVAVENEAYQPFQQAVLSPVVDLGKLTIVTVLLSR